MPAKLATLEHLTGHTFNEIVWLERSVTHRSWVFENMPAATSAEMHVAENESLEFVGDSVLGLVIAEQLFRNNPTLSEGDLTLMKHHLVSTATLAKLGAEMDLGKYVRVGRGEELTGGRQKHTLLANTLEAIIGAVFIDGGYVAAKVVIGRFFFNEMRNASPKSSLDFKTLLQETLQAEKLTAPRYNVTRTDGPPHAREFFVEAIWEGGTSNGHGRSIKAAEMMAASIAVDELNTKKKNEKQPAA